MHFLYNLFNKIESESRSFCLFFICFDAEEFVKYMFHIFRRDSYACVCDCHSNNILGLVPASLEWNDDDPAIYQGR